MAVADELPVVPAFSTRWGLPSVSVARKMCELISDTPWCDEEGNEDHSVCTSSPVCASWPDPHPYSDLDG